MITPMGHNIVHNRRLELHSDKVGTRSVTDLSQDPVPSLLCLGISHTMLVRLMAMMSMCMVTARRRFK